MEPLPPPRGGDGGVTETLLFTSSFSKPTGGLPFPQSRVWSSCRLHTLLHTLPAVVFLPFISATPQTRPSILGASETAHGHLFIFDTNVHDTHLDSQPTTTTQVEPGPLGQVGWGEELVGATICLSSLPRLQPRFQVHRYRRHRCWPLRGYKGGASS